MCQDQSSICLSITSRLLHLCAYILAPISQLRKTPTESYPTGNHDAFTCSSFIAETLTPFISSRMPSRLMPHDYSPKYPCSLGSTCDHVPRSRGTPLHPSSPTLILSDKLLRHQGFPYTHGPILRLASLHACKQAPKS